MENHIVCIYLLYMYDMYVSIIIYIFYYCSSVLLSKNMFDHFFLLAVFGSVKVEFPHRSLTLFFSAVWIVVYNKIRGHSRPIDRDG